MYSTNCKFYKTMSPPMNLPEMAAFDDFHSKTSRRSIVGESNEKFGNSTLDRGCGWGTITSCQASTLGFWVPLKNMLPLNCCY